MAAQGDAEAQSSLGSMYAKGEGVTQDDAEAVRWYRLAAQQEHVTAQVMPGRHYATGGGDAPDRVTAHMWLSLAVAAEAVAKRRDGYAEEPEAIAAEMTPEEIAEAQHRAREGRPTPEP